MSHKSPTNLAIALIFAVLCPLLIAAPLRGAEPASRPFRFTRADGGPTTGPGGGGGGGPGGMILDRAREIVSGLDLSTEQKTKVDAVFNKAREDFQELRTNFESLQPQERMERMRDFMAGVRQNLSDVLTPPQRDAMNEKFEAARQQFRERFGQGAGGGATTRPAGAATSRPGAGPGGPEGFAERLRTNLQKLDLSADQKAKVQALFDDVKSKAESLRAEAQAGSEEARDKVRQLFQDTRQKLTGILTEEQRTKLRELMGGGGGPTGGRGERGGGPGERRPGARRGEPGRPGAGKSAAQSNADDTMMLEGSSSSAGSNAKSKIQNPQSEIPTGPAVGQPAPQLTLKKLDGSTLGLSSLKGHVVVLEFGSLSSPVFRTHAPAMEKLRSDYGIRAQFYVVYTKEAHATGEWEIDRNKDDGVQIEQPKSIDARKTLADSARQKLKIATPILLDSIDNEAAKSFGANENSAYVINRDGTIAARQQWFEPNALRRAIDQATSNHPATRPAP